MIIQQVDLWHVAVPLPAPFYPSWIPGFPQTENRFTLVRIRTKSGLEGWSAGAAFGRERQGLGSVLGPYLIGERADDIASIRQRLRELSYLGWRVGWLEPACWDLIGKARGKPVYELFGGSRGTIQLYASTGSVRTAEERIPEVQRHLEDGFSAVKLRVHAMDPTEDIRQITETRKAIGDAPILGVDANQAWRVAIVGEAPLWDLKRATEFCAAAADAGYAWVEEPLPMDAYEDLARLSATSAVPVAGGELNNSGLPEFTTMIAKGCYKVYQPDAMFTGGLAETWEIIRRVAAAGARYTPHTWTNGIGFAVNMQLYAASPWRSSSFLEYPIDPPGWVPSARDGLLTEPWIHNRGSLDLPTAPGLGFAIDRGALRRWGKHFYRASPVRVAVQAVLDKGIAVAREAGAVRSARLDTHLKYLTAEEIQGRDLISPFIRPVEQPEPLPDAP